MKNGDTLITMREVLIYQQENVPLPLYGAKYSHRILHQLQNITKKLIYINYPHKIRETEEFIVGEKRYDLVRE